MALEAVVFPQDFFGYGWGGGAAWRGDLGEMLEAECEMGGGGGGGVDGVLDASCSSLVQNRVQEWNVNCPPAPAPAAAEGSRRKRQRTRSVKNKEEVESQRMTHIAVERNRRRQMNEYLAVLRSLMPASYVQRGDQASIVAGAINYVKELEQLLQSLEVQKRLKQRADAAGIASAFDDFFSFPQYCAYSPAAGDAAGGEADEAGHQTGTANIEVTMVESHANLKVLSRRRPRQLFELVVGLQTLRLLPLHLNVTSVHHMAMYSFSLKVEDDCPYTSVDEIATAVHQMLGKIQEAANF
ncbi:transcription factor bHLH96-like [Zingiber officinale]|uniref:transcription factor bHLH96-like n=1 Tax=Zingiber officinale TaxID=94328 RepID=UPI001C4D4A07|nr:transcription factor bHLH96-like [Zingiber officinale]